MIEERNQFIANLNGKWEKGRQDNYHSYHKHGMSNKEIIRYETTPTTACYVEDRNTLDWPTEFNMQNELER